MLNANVTRIHPFCMGKKRTCALWCGFFLLCTCSLQVSCVFTVSHAHHPIFCGHQFRLVNGPADFAGHMSKQSSPAVVFRTVRLNFWSRGPKKRIQLKWRYFACHWRLACCSGCPHADHGRQMSEGTRGRPGPDCTTHVCVHCTRTYVDWKT